jgi:yeast amino acid transporter
MMGLGMLSCFLLTFSGAAIGTGLFYQSGKVLYFAGPVPACVAYLLMGSVVYTVLVHLSSKHSGLSKKISYGEMVSFLPLPGGFFALANRNLSPSLVS